MVTRAIFVKCVQNGLQFTFCLITSPVFEVQKCNTPFWKWHKNRVQMALTIVESNEKWRFYEFLAAFRLKDFQSCFAISQCTKK